VFPVFIFLSPIFFSLFFCLISFQFSYRAIGRFGGMLARFAVCALAAVFTGLPTAGRALGAAVANGQSPADGCRVSPRRRALADKSRGADHSRRAAVAAAVDEVTVGVTRRNEIAQHAF
jgi:hypothetical protein